MRRLVVSIIVASGLVLIGAGSAHADPVPGASAAKAAAGKKVCKVTDPKLNELSGIVATQDGYIVINDSSAQERVFFLDEDCGITDDVSYTGAGPRDTEDLVLSADGETLWIADIGDNDKSRETIALWTMPADGSKRPKIHRLSYPDGGHDAEAMLLNGDGTPIIVTKEVGKPAALYTPTAKLETDNNEGVPLQRVGEITVPSSDTSGNTFARLGRGTIDGGAVAPGGGKVVLRTYTDALEWTVTNGDVLAALKGKPRVTPLPDEPLGEAITYGPDGKNYYTVSDMQGKPEAADNYILRYTPVTKTAPAKAAVSDAKESGPSWYQNLTINDITYMVGGVGVLGAILVGFGIFGIMRARKRPPLDPKVKKGGDPDGPRPIDAETELLAVGGAASGRGTRPASGAGVYGAKPAAPVYGGAGGRPPQGTQPGSRPGQSGQPGGRPGQSGQPGGRPGQTVPPGGRPGQGGQPGGRPGQPGTRSGQPVARPGQGGQPSGRPGPGGAGTGRAGGSGVYGAPPPAHPQAPPGRGNSGGGRTIGFFGQGTEQADGGRPAPSGMTDYADLNGNGRGGDLDNPEYGRR
jgi:hypothetical protein